MGLVESLQQMELNITFKQVKRAKLRLEGTQFLLSLINKVFIGCVKYAILAGWQGLSTNTSKRR